jgi:lipopolysaccharide transport system ATP-binding protein
MTLAIRVQDLSKAYLIRHASQPSYSALRDEIASGTAAIGRTLKNLLRGERGGAPKYQEFWALKGVSFEIRKGDRVGIVGRNGAGKSTLLKVLSRVTEPTSGRVEITGRIASLLDVGTGFHPELTGRENIFLNGAILGMTRGEIERSFDAIVDFAGVETFLDTPVKRFSSGMYLRLAFAVAAFLQPDILVVDEVLAVGDAEFQRKCLGKMEEVSKSAGRTVVFVSHDIAAVNRLCNKAILLKQGSVQAIGQADEVTSRYLSDGGEDLAKREWPESAAPGDAVAKLSSVQVTQNGSPAPSIDIRYPVAIEMQYRVLGDAAELMCGFSFFDQAGTALFVSGDFSDAAWCGPRKAGSYRSVCTVPGNLFAEGFIRVAVEVSTRSPVYEIHFIVFDAVSFQVVDAMGPGSVRGGWGRPIPGVMRPACQWSTAALD